MTKRMTRVPSREEINAAAKHLLPMLHERAPVTSPDYANETFTLMADGQRAVEVVGRAINCEKALRDLITAGNAQERHDATWRAREYLLKIDRGDA
jgi:hypothetical protein